MNLNAAHIDKGHMTAIQNHIEKYIGKIDYIFHEHLSDNVHIDVCIIKPSEKIPYAVLVTMGMSAKPMNTPVGYNCSYCELLAVLPKEWKLAEEDFKDENNYWPIRTLKKLAVYPHACNTYLRLGHSIPNNDPPSPYAKNTKLCCSLLDVPPKEIPSKEDFIKLHLKNGKDIFFWNLFPIYREEMDFKLKQGYEKLIDLVESRGIATIVDPNRINVCKKAFSFFK